MSDAPDVRVMHTDLVEAGWKEERYMLYKAPCGCYFRGPYRAWVEMNGTHLANHIAAGYSPPRRSGSHE